MQWYSAQYTRRKEKDWSVVTRNTLWHLTLKKTEGTIYLMSKEHMHHLPPPLFLPSKGGWGGADLTNKYSHGAKEKAMLKTWHTNVTRPLFVHCLPRSIFVQQLVGNLGKGRKDAGVSPQGTRGPNLVPSSSSPYHSCVCSSISIGVSPTEPGPE